MGERPAPDQQPRICIGFGKREGKCENVAGTPWTPLWCDECDQERRDHITRQFEKIAEGFER